MRPPGSPRCGVPGRLHIRAAGERPPRARPQRRGSPGPIPNPAVKPAFAESTAAPGCGRAGRRARGGRFSMRAEKARRGMPPCGPVCVSGPVPRARGVSRGMRGAPRVCRDSSAGLSAFLWLRAYPRRLRDRRAKGPCRIVRESIAKPPAPANPLHGRCPRTADGRISCARRPVEGFFSAGEFCVTRMLSIRQCWFGQRLFCIPCYLRACFLGIPSVRWQHRALHGAQGNHFAGSFRLQALLAFRLLLCMGLRAFGFRYM